MKKKDWGWISAGLVSICLLAIFYMVFMIDSIEKITQRVNQIYEHPYQVAGEARTMQTRLYEMKEYLPSLLNADYEDPRDIIQLLKERDDLQDMSLAEIKRLYQGDSSEIDAVEDALLAMRAARWQAVDDCLGQTNMDEVMRYVEKYITPCSIVEDRALRQIIESADRQVNEIQQEILVLGRATMIGAVVLCFLIILMAVYSRWREQRKNREITYQQWLFNLLTANVDDVFYVFNREKGMVEYTSENSERIFGIRSEEFLRNPTILSKHFLPGTDEQIADMFCDGPLLTSAERDLRCRRGEQILDIKLRIYPIRNKDKLERYIAVLSDQTKTVAKEHALRDALASAQSANAAKRNFLSRMSHEIRTPLNAVIGMTAIAANRLDHPDRIEDCLKKITHSSKHLLALINDVLDMSKIEDGKLVVGHEQFDFRSLIESVTSIVYAQSIERHQNFEVSLSGLTEEMLTGDPMRLNQVLLNLLSNALKFTPAGGEIRLEVRQLRTKGNRVTLRFVVRDTGIGMSEDFLTHLYQPFEQADSSISQKYGGTGLGMSITKNLISMMGGSIAVQSTLGEGTVFTVELPFEIAQGESSAQRLQLEELRVLVVDDDSDSCEHASLLLENLGIQSDWSLTGRGAVERVMLAHEQGQDYDVCFIDWRMPDQDGVETTRQIREHVSADTLIIIISAYDWNAIEAPALAAGANAFIAKPVFASSLYNTLLSVTHRTPDVVQAGVIAQEQYDFTQNKVLLVEDNELNLEIAEEILKMTGLSVDCAGNGKLAVEAFLRSAPGEYAAILMDVQMPVMNGYEATRTIRALAHPCARTVPIIAMTANAFRDDIAAAREAGMDGHIAKPIDIAVLYRTLAPYMTKRL